MLSEVSDEYLGEYSVNVPESMKYPTQIEYDEKHKYLSGMVKKLYWLQSEKCLTFAFLLLVLSTAMFGMSFMMEANDRM